MTSIVLHKISDATGQTLDIVSRACIVQFSDVRPGSQHVMDGDCYAKIDDLHYVLAHDEGHSLVDINDVDIILIGVSRTTKTPTSIYLANQGYKTANVPYIPGMPLPKELLQAQRPLIDVIKKSVEEIADTIIYMLNNRLNGAL